MANWEQFGSLVKLDFSIHGTPDNQAANVYANGRNMVELIITVDVRDGNDKRLDVTDDELKKELYVCHSETGESLKSPWVVSDDPNEYVNGTSDRSDKSSDTDTDTDTIRYVYKYLSCSKNEHNEFTEKISVGINIPGVGKFDTSRNGTPTKGRNGHVFRSPKSFDITALRPIDYGIRDNLKIEYGAFKTLSENIEWMSRPKSDTPREYFSGYFKGHSNGVAKQRLVYIRPNKSTTGQEKFKEKKIEYDPINNRHVSTGTIWWSRDTSEYEPCFSVLSNKNEYGRPCAVIGRGYGCDDYQVNLWFSHKNNININGIFYVVDSSSYHQFNSNEATILKKNHAPEDEDGAATLLLCKLIMPESNSCQHYWEDVIREITVNVIDYHGNDGSFQLTFDAKDNFDQPALL